MSDRETKILFAAGVSDDGKSHQVVLGISKPAFEHLAGGLTQTFDLTKIGIPLQLVVFTADSYDHARRLIDEAMAAKGQAYLDETRRDFGIDNGGGKDHG